MPETTMNSQLEQEYSEEQLRRHTVGPLVPLNGPITLVVYDPEWPEQFEREAARIGRALGDRALRIEHIGSTSVPKLIAKPIIDIMLIVADSADETSYVPALEGAGYVLRIREPEWHQHRVFKGPEININLHVYSEGCTEIERVLLFRDWLRNNPADRALYAETKRDLGNRQWKHVQNYADAKTTVVEAIIARARAGADINTERRP